MARGHIRARGNGYAVVVEVPAGPDGKRRQRWYTAPNKKAAENLLTEKLAEIDAGEYVEPVKTTLLQHLERWYEANEHRWADNTRKGYQVAIRQHIGPNIGAVKLQRLTTQQIEQCYARLRAAGLSETTLNRDHAVLRGALKQAVRWNIIRRNPCDLMDPPKPEDFEAHAWEPEQIEQWRAETWESEYGPLFALALYTGLRRGELIGLRWHDINLEDRILEVRGQSPKQVDGVWVWPEPKNKPSRRSVPLRFGAVDVLREQRRRQVQRRLSMGEIWHDLDVVFDRGDGIPYKPSAVTSAWDRMIKRSSLPTIRLHDTRHTAVTLMLEAGIPIHIVSKIVGHSVATMTERYGHIRPKALRDHIDVMDRLG